MVAMTDVKTPLEDRTETVSRVVAALLSGTTDGEIEQEVLRAALELADRSLIELPEVGLWLALSEIALIDGLDELDLTDDSVVIDLRDDTSAPVVVEVITVDIDDDEPEPEPETAPVIEATSIEVTWVEAPPRDAAPETGPPSTGDELPEPAVEGRRRPRRWRLLIRRRRRVPDTVAPDTVAPDAPGTDDPAAWPPPTGEPATIVAPDPAVMALAGRITALHAHLVESLGPAIARLPLGDPARRGAVTVVRTPTERLALLGNAGRLDAHLRAALSDPVTVALLSPDRPGTSRPAPYWPPHLARRLASLDDALRTALAEPVSTTMPDPCRPNGARFDPAWPPSLVRRLRTLDLFLRQRLDVPTERPAAILRQSATTPGARPDPYWPRHLVRAGLTPTPLPPAPRSADDLEAELQRRLGDVALVGEAEVDDLVAEIEISLAQLVRREPLDRLGRTSPATLATFLVRQTLLHPNPADFDAGLPITALRRTNAVGLAFSEALVRLSKPVFREVEQRDEFDHRVRYLRRMQLHGGIPQAALPGVLEALHESHWAGARSGREVARDWLAASRAVTSQIGDPAFRLLTRTDHGARMLEPLLELVRWRGLDDAHDGPPADLDPLPPRLVADAWRLLARRPPPSTKWGEPSRPRLVVGDVPGDGPQLELPRSSERWLLNGELLGYGSPTHRKTMPMPANRSGRWVVTVGAARRSSPLDVAIGSAATDRIVLFFDESGAYHHHALPIGGATASVVVPAGSKVDGEVGRTLLVGRWIGYERVEVELDLDEITVAQRGREPVTIAVDRRLGDVLQRPSGAAGVTTSAPPLRLAFRGQVPPAAAVEVVVADGPTRSTALLSDLWIAEEHGVYSLDLLVEPGAERAASLTVVRSGFEPSVREVTVAAMPARPVTAPTVEVDGQRARVRAALTAFVAGTTLPDPDDRWRRDPLLAAAADAWVDRAAQGRWRAHTGWNPPAAGDAVDVALRALVDPVAAAILGAATTDGSSGGASPGARLLTREGWAAALGEVDALAAWHRRHRRPIRQWRTTLASLHNLAGLWSALEPTESGRVLSGLVSAALVAAVDGPHRDAAADRVAEALLPAPALAESAVVLAFAYAAIQRLHPESRFRPIAVARA